MSDHRRLDLHVKGAGRWRRRNAGGCLSGYRARARARIRTLLQAAWFSGALSLLATACVRAPNVIYLVDDKTVIETQASGEFTPLENDLRNVALSPRGEPYVRSQIDGQVQGNGELDTLVRLYSDLRTDQERIDALLTRRCVGEANSGLLEPTPSTCAGVVDVNDVARLLERANRNRQQIWAWLMGRKPGTSEADVRRVWREKHLEAVVCGGQVQQPDGSWGLKGCA